MRKFVFILMLLISTAPLAQGANVKIAAHVADINPVGAGRCKYELVIAAGDNFKLDQVFVEVDLTSSQTQVDNQMKDAVVGVMNDPNTGTGLPTNFTSNDVTLR